ncbi:hypothetical protein VTN77DRAFT_6881 [Rasamsonia byssochlamydoides]|uniref:uncharacterized protein n=1 Tax=Rasamsonia byssochlamydoides TaxID=89139 RepID=UPI00374289F2
MVFATLCLHSMKFRGVVAKVHENNNTPLLVESGAAASNSLPLDLNEILQSVSRISEMTSDMNRTIHAIYELLILQGTNDPNPKAKQFSRIGKKNESEEILSAILSVFITVTWTFGLMMFLSALRTVSKVLMHDAVLFGMAAANGTLAVMVFCLEEARPGLDYILYTAWMVDLGFLCGILFHGRRLMNEFKTL